MGGGEGAPAHSTHQSAHTPTPTHTTQKILNLILNTTQYHLETPLKTLTHLETKTP